MVSERRHVSKEIRSQRHQPRPGMGREEVQASHFPACMKKSRILGESKLVAALPEVDALTHRAPRVMTELQIWLDCRSRPVYCLSISGRNVIVAGA